MTSRKRLANAIEGSPVDRIPVTFWRHFFREERTPQGLAEAMLRFQESYSWDMMKVNPGTYYCAEGWGARLAWPSGQDEAPVLAEPFIRRESDWQRLAARGAGDGAFGAHLEALSIIRAHIDPDVPFITTVFSPISVAGQLAGGDEHLKAHIAESPGSVQQALETIADTLVAFTQEVLNLGADGIFFPTTHWATRRNMSIEQYRRFAAPYDLHYLNAIRERAKIILLHVCREQNIIEDLLEYPADILNWDSRAPSNPGIDTIRRRTSRAILGGVSASSLLGGSPGKAIREAQDALDNSGGVRFILGAGCVIAPDTPAGNLAIMKEWAAAPSKTPT